MHDVSKWIKHSVVPPYLLEAIRDPPEVRWADISHQDWNLDFKRGSRQIGSSYILVRKITFIGMGSNKLLGERVRAQDTQGMWQMPEFYLESSKVKGSSSQTSTLWFLNTWQLCTCNMNSIGETPDSLRGPSQVPSSQVPLAVEVHPWCSFSRSVPLLTGKLPPASQYKLRVPEPGLSSHSIAHVAFPDLGGKRQ